MIFRNTFFFSWFHFTELTAAFRKSKSSTIKIRAIAYWYNVCIFVDKIRLLINKKKLMLFRFQITTAIVTVYWNLEFFFLKQSLVYTKCSIFSEETKNVLSQGAKIHDHCLKWNTRFYCVIYHFICQFIDGNKILPMHVQYIVIFNWQ